MALLGLWMKGAGPGGSTLGVMLGPYSSASFSLAPGCREGAMLCHTLPPHPRPTAVGSASHGLRPLRQGASTSLPSVKLTFPGVPPQRRNYAHPGAAVYMVTTFCAIFLSFFFFPSTSLKMNLCNFSVKLSLL